MHRVPQPHHLDESIDAVTKAVSFEGPSAVIFRAPCVNLIKPEGSCFDQCGNMHGLQMRTAIGCPAIGFNGEVATIDETLCTGCGLCTQVLSIWGHRASVPACIEAIGRWASRVLLSPWLSAASKRTVCRILIEGARITLVGFVRPMIIGVLPNEECSAHWYGGQGTVLAAKILAQAAQARGWHVRTAETIGMAQRGGSVTSHVRMGNEGEHVASPLVGAAAADMLIAFEPGAKRRVCSGFSLRTACLSRRRM